MTLIQTLMATLPVILIILLGFVFNRISLLKQETVHDLKSLVVNVTLPLVLFRAFGSMTFQLRFLVIVAAVFFACWIVMLISTRLRGVPGLRSKYAAFLMSGFEAGMLGYAVFGSIFGEANIPVFAVVDLGQVLFVFFVLVTRLQALEGRQQNLQETFINFIKTPVIIAILTGILCNVSGLYEFLGDTMLGQILFTVVGTLAGLTTPLVAIIIGFGLKFRSGHAGAAIQTVALRLLVWIALALLINHFIIRQWFQLDAIFEAAVLLLFVMPAPFVIPLYSRTEDEGEQDYILNSLSIGTIAALIGVVIIRLIFT